MKEDTKSRIREEIDDIFTAIGKDETTGLYNILRLVVAFPLAANFDSKSAKVKAALQEDDHALAQLSMTVLVSALATTDCAPSIISMLTAALQRTREESDDEAKAGQFNPNSRRMDWQ